jgi:hypothetical protein
MNLKKAFHHRAHRDHRGKTRSYDYRLMMSTRCLTDSNSGSPVASASSKYFLTFLAVMPDLIRHPERIEKPGFRHRTAGMTNKETTLWTDTKYDLVPSILLNQNGKIFLRLFLYCIHPLWQERLSLLAYRQVQVVELLSGCRLVSLQAFSLFTIHFSLFTVV